MQVTSDCFSMEVGSDVSLSTEVSALTLPSRLRTAGPVEPDAFFGRTHPLLGVPWARAPFRPMRVPDLLPAGIARPHAFNGRHRGQEPKLSLAAAGIGIDRSAWEQAPISSGCSEQGRAQRAVRRARVGATTWVPR